jgi:hypothetical protein
MKRLIVTRSSATGGMRPDTSENSQISPSTIVRAARAAGSHLTSRQSCCKAGKAYLRQFGSHPGNPGQKHPPELPRVLSLFWVVLWQRSMDDLRAGRR